LMSVKTIRKTIYSLWLNSVNTSIIDSISVVLIEK
jgi:hypothetical protein